MTTVQTTIAAAGSKGQNPDGLRPRSRRFQLLAICVVATCVPGAALAYFGSFRVMAAFLKGHRVIASCREIDFGRGRLGEVKEATVTIRNFRNVPVVVTGASVSCSCIKATSALPLTLDAGESAKLRFEVRLTGKGPQFEQSASILTNDAQDAAISVWIRATITNTVPNPDSASG